MEVLWDIDQIPPDFGHTAVTLGNFDGVHRGHQAVLGQLAAGRTVDEVLADHPYLECADVLAVLEFAATAVQDRELHLSAVAA